MEAWLDVEHAKERAPELLQRIEDGEEIEVSVGVFVETDDEATGEHDGKPYRGAWRNIKPDHLALLPAGVVGACSREMGCGVRAALSNSNNQYRQGDLMDGFKTLRNIPMSERDKMPAADFAGPNRSFPIAEPGDVGAAAQSLGRAKGDTDPIKAKIISIAYRKGPAFYSHLPEAWKRKKDQKNAGSILARIASLIFGQAAMDMSDMDLRQELEDELRKVDSRTLSLGPVYDDYVVYTVFGTEMAHYKRTYQLADDGSVTFGDPLAVEPVHSWEPMTASKHEDTTQTGDKVMTKCELVKFLETATEDQVKALSAAVEAKVEPKVEPKAEATAIRVETEKAEKTEPKAPTFDEVLATATPEVRDSIRAGVKIAADKKTATIAALKATGRNDFADEQLASKSQCELDRMLKLADVKAAVDFSGRGTARETEKTEAPAAPDLTAAIRAARGQK
jgi:hypothetical protein